MTYNIQDVQKRILHNISHLVELNQILEAYAENQSDDNLSSVIEVYDRVSSESTKLADSIKYSLTNFVKLASASFDEEVDIIVEPAEDGNGFKL